MGYFKLDISDIIVVYDDLSLDMGCLRFRANGSDGGHNGIKSIIQSLGGNKNFTRLNFKLLAKHSPKEIKNPCLFILPIYKCKELHTAILDKLNKNEIKKNNTKAIPKNQNQSPEILSIINSNNLSKNNDKSWNNLGKSNFDIKPEYNSKKSSKKPALSIDFKIGFTNKNNRPPDTAKTSRK